MKNVITKKLSILFRCSLVIIITSLLLSSCQNNDLEIQQDFPFEVEILPVPSKIAENETVEIRISLITPSNFNGTTYSVRHFQFEGSGQLRYYNDEPYLPNEEYPLKQKQFRLYYTSQASESHQFSIWIKDSFGNERRVDFEFDNAS
ncbi:TraQ conjugal transfer family protein [Chryseobacterium sp. 5_R23647]|uniref:TraQ conjugal transfer family protein n=1 Tax=Chryseobacterium sp. 5_R23647 TaxID=2258964 RepID=UPI000E285EFA|nr:TraQ conjugal transfer family protein [Chryseobacterium sp. 5_R23647]REC42060.1 conjugal transfer protein TraQ [Chryseobacterium sp. 5_R23647]